MVKHKYYVRYPHNFDNEYTLRLSECESDDDELIAAGYDRITRREAVKLARLEQWRRRYTDGGYADAVVTPWPRNEWEAMYFDLPGECRYLTTCDGVIYTRI